LSDINKNIPTEEKFVILNKLNVFSIKLLGIIMINIRLQ